MNAEVEANVKPRPEEVGYFVNPESILPPDSDSGKTINCSPSDVPDAPPFYGSVKLHSNVGNKSHGPVLHPVASRGALLPPFCSCATTHKSRHFCSWGPFSNA